MHIYMYVYLLSFDGQSINIQYYTIHSFHQDILLRVLNITREIKICHSRWGIPIESYSYYKFNRSLILSSYIGGIWDFATGIIHRHIGDLIAFMVTTSELKTTTHILEVNSNKLITATKLVSYSAGI